MILVGESCLTLFFILFIINKDDVTLDDRDFLMKIIARIHTDFPSKFGVPRQMVLSILWKPQ